jgi:hypothetical protein
MIQMNPYTEGFESYGGEDFNPYPADSLAASEWEEGRCNAEQEAGDEYADYCDPSMRDLYE